MKTNKLSRQIELANELFDTAEYTQAKQMCLRVLKKSPKCAEMLHCLGLIYSKENNFEAAISLLNRAIKLHDNLQWQQNLASIYFNKGKLNKSKRLLQIILQTDPDFAEAYLMLGDIHFSSGNDNAAEENYYQALMLNPSLIKAYHGLGLILTKQGFIQASISAFQHLLRFKLNQEDTAHILQSMAASYLLQGQASDALDCLSKAMERNPGLHQTHSAYLATLNYLYGFEGEKVFIEYLQFNLNHTLLLDNVTFYHSNNVDPHKKLKIGYVSPDFRNHALFNLIEPIFRNASQQEFSIYCYSSHFENDSETEMLKENIGAWFNCSDLSDSELASHIKDDQIDILIDLAGHTAGNRLMTFARKPAPIQITFAGYPYTTGLTAMDYRITDRYMDPEGMTEQFHSEQLLYLPSSAFFYPPEVTPEVNRLPALESEFFSFASFNQPYKLTDEVFEVWATILNQVKNSRLFMLLGDSENEVIQEKYRRKFNLLGVKPNQLIFFGKQSIDKYLELHHQIDLCLDTFPFNGGTTTHYSLWMGVPAVTLAGNTPCSRVGVTILSAIKLNQFIASSAADYINICKHFADNLSQLAAIRQSLRQRMKKSSIRDEQGFVSNLENAYRQVWKKWCATQNAEKKQ